VTEILSGDSCLSVCMRCKPAGWVGDDDQRPGQILATAVLGELAQRGLHVRMREIRCMSQCKRPCVVAFSGSDRFTYLFGDLDPATDARAIVDAFELYQSRPLGFMERADRPERLRAGILGRVPPLLTDATLVEADGMTAAFSE
jgi:predicted metal-binding protein